MDQNAFRRPLTGPGVLTVSAFVALTLGVWGCGGGKTTAPVKLVPLTVTAQGLGGAAQRFAAASLTSGVAATDTIPVTFTQALLVVRDVRFVLPDEFMGGDDTDTTGMGETDSTGFGETDSTGMHEDDGDDDGGQVRFHGPYVIDLLAGTAQKLDTQMVPPGDYERVQGHLQPLHAGDEPASAHPDLVGYTVWLEGDIAGDGGGHFVYKTPINNEFQIRGGFTVAQDTPATAFVTFDLSRFLTDREGHFLDPRIADNDKWIQQAIRHAIKVGMDDDHDGAIDDDMHGEEDSILP